jgi:hypothetical protein
MLEKCNLCIKEKDMGNILKPILTYIEPKNLPLHCAINNFANWKDNFMGKDFMIKVLENHFVEVGEVIDWPEWKKLLIDDFDDIKPQNRTLRCYKEYDYWGYNKDDIFLFTTSDIRSAILLSKKRLEIIKALKKSRLINGPNYPPSNERGNLWIGIEWETPTQGYNPYLYIDSKKLSLRIWDENENKYKDQENSIVLNSENLESEVEKLKIWIQKLGTNTTS